MGNFAVQFLICNIFICIMIILLLAAKRILKRCLTSRMQYHLWFVLLGLLAVPFLPVRSINWFLPVFSWIKNCWQISASAAETAGEENAVFFPAGSSLRLNDIGIAVSTKTPSGIGFVLFILWISGMLAMVVFLLRSALRFHALKKSSLPLQNPAICSLYQDCLSVMHITKDIPVYSTAFLKSPVITGLFKPCIYLPLHLISDYDEKEIRYMLLHELSHYKHKDALAGCLMNIAGIWYWFNPFVWYARKEMKNDREMACDISVLQMLEADAYEDYGNTLINFAEKISHLSYPFAVGISSSMAQMRKRILNIAAYEKTSFKKRLSGYFAYALITLFLSGFVPVLCIQAAGRNRYFFHEQGKTVAAIDLTAAFGDQEGCFVLYDNTADTWQIYNQELATARTAPVSTYKIYSALLGLESGIISPGHSVIPWNGQHYAFEAWNADQTLRSAMQNSVNWYFQAIDKQAGLPAIKEHIQKTGYGSQTISGDLTAYWADSSLCISPIEQVELLKKFYYNEFGFSPENIHAVKDAMYLAAKNGSRIYGKTGTGEKEGKNMLGWFIGFIEQKDHTRFFAMRIQNGKLATGSAAADLTFSILSGLNIC